MADSGRRFSIYVIIVIVIGLVAAFLIGIFSTTISFGDFFFTTKYYDTPLDAYNAGYTSDSYYGDVSAETEMGFLPLGDEIGLFIGKVNDEIFTVQEIVIKNDKYAKRGSGYIYDTTESSDGSEYWNYTDFRGVYEKWCVLYGKAETESREGARSVTEYTFSEDFTVYLALLEE